MYSRELTIWGGMLLLLGMLVFAHWKAAEEQKLLPVVVRTDDGSCVTNHPPRTWTIIADVSTDIVSALADALADSEFDFDDD